MGWDLVSRTGADGLETLEWVTRRLAGLHTIDAQHYVEADVTYDFPMVAACLLGLFACGNLLRSTVIAFFGYLLGVTASNEVHNPWRGNTPREAFTLDIWLCMCRLAATLLALDAFSPLCISLCGDEDPEGCIPLSVPAIDKASCEEAGMHFHTALGPLREVALNSWFACNTWSACAGELVKPWPLVNIPVRLSALFFWQAAAALDRLLLVILEPARGWLLAALYNVFFVATLLNAYRLGALKPAATLLLVHDTSAAVLHLANALGQVVNSPSCVVGSGAADEPQATCRMQLVKEKLVVAAFTLASFVFWYLRVGNVARLGYSLVVGSPGDIQGDLLKWLLTIEGFGACFVCGVLIATDLYWALLLLRACIHALKGGHLSGQSLGTSTTRGAFMAAAGAGYPFTAQVAVTVSCNRPKTE